jgi:hypothetical protein
MKNMLFAWLLLLAPAWLSGQVPGDNAAKASLRSYLEPGFNRPDSAIVSGDYGYSDNLIVFSYSGDTVTETSRARIAETGLWNTLNYRTETYAFDAYGNRILYMSSSYINNVLQWAGKEEYAFNSFGMTVFEKYYNLVDGKWDIIGNVNYEYDKSGLLIGGSSTEKGVTYPILVSGTLENLVLTATLGSVVIAQYVRHYDPVTLKELASETYLPSKKGGMELDIAYTYTYDAAGRMTSKLMNDMNEYFYKTEYAYNGSGKRISATEYYTYDLDEPFSLNLKTEYAFTGNRLDKIAMTYHFADGSTRTSTTTFYYSRDAGVVTPEASKALRVYASDGHITFVLPEPAGKASLQLIDLSGRTVLKAEAVSGHPVAIPSLRGGVYVYRILSGGTSHSGKIYIH